MTAYRIVTKVYWYLSHKSFNVRIKNRQGVFYTALVAYKRKPKQKKKYEEGKKRNDLRERE